MAFRFPVCCQILYPFFLFTSIRLSSRRALSNRMGSQTQNHSRRSSGPRSVRGSRTASMSANINRRKKDRLESFRKFKFCLAAPSPLPGAATMHEDESSRRLFPYWEGELTCFSYESQFVIEHLVYQNKLLPHLKRDWREAKKAKFWKCEISYFKFWA